MRVSTLRSQFQCSSFFNSRQLQCAVSQVTVPCMICQDEAGSFYNFFFFSTPEEVSEYQLDVSYLEFWSTVNNVSQW